MPLPLPKLDDRTFAQLMSEAKARLKASTTEWTDTSPSDPGIVLLELYAFLTETMIARLNRLPDKAYIAFLNLLGVTLQPPAAAHVELVFTKTQQMARRVVEIPVGTQVTARGGGAGEPPIFITEEPLRIGGNDPSGTVTAVHAQQIEGEPVGTGTGEAGIMVQVSDPPIIAPTGDGRDLVVALEVRPEDTHERLHELEFEGVTYRIWREVEHFADLGDDRYVYRVDRLSGVIQFAPGARLTNADGELSEAPEVLGGAEVPPANSVIRVWYRRGGGVEGNLAANTLTVLKSPILGVEVTNPEAATGGRSAESLPNARIRGSRELHALDRAVTVRDFEDLARKTPGIARAKAFTEAEWSYGRRGAVDVLLVPDVPLEQWEDGRLSLETLQASQTALALEQVETALQERKPVGTVCKVEWAHYIPVSVSATVKLRPEEDAEAVRERLMKRLYQTICPLTTPDVNTRGWQFGQSLRASHIYDVALSEPGVRYVDNIVMRVNSAPDIVASIATDYHQADAWYACSGNTLFRSLDNGDCWEPWRPPDDFAEIDQTLWKVVANPDYAGLVALCTRSATGSRVYMSRDCGETWQNKLAEFGNDEIESMAWMTRNHEPFLLIASDQALYELPVLHENPSALRLNVVPHTPQLGFYAVVSAADVSGNVNIAVAAQKLGQVGGVFLSSDGGRSFRPLIDDQTKTNLSEEDIRVLEIQQDGPRLFLWAGAYVLSGTEPGKGCWRWEIMRPQEDPSEGWVAYSKGWAAGSCYAIAFPDKDTVIVGTHRGGIMHLRVDTADPVWAAVAPNESGGLPIRGTDNRAFLPIHSIATDPQGAYIMGGARGLIVEGTQALRGQGIYRAKASKQDADYGRWKYTRVCSTTFVDRVTLPPHRLFVSGEHTLEVTSEDDETF